MATLEQIGRALKAADAAGNTEDARRLAAAYKAARNAQSGPADFSGVTATVNGERVGKSGVRESERQAQIAAMDQAADYEGQLDSLNTQEGIGRALGVGGRAMWRGLAAIPDIVVAPLAYGINKLGEKGQTTESLITGERERYFPKQKTITETADYAMDLMGAPRPETPQERISNDLTSGLTSTMATLGTGALLQANQLPAAAPTVRNAFGNLLAGQPRTQIAATAAGTGASSVAREGGATPGQQAAIGLTAGLLPGAATYGGAATTRGLIRGSSGATMEENINAFRGAGTTPTVGQAAANRGMQGVETFLATVPGGAGPMAAKATTQAKQVGARLDDLAGNLSPRGGGASAETAGRAVTKGVGAFAKNIKERRNALYQQADAAIPADSRVTVSNTQAALDDLNAAIEGAPNVGRFFQNARIQGIQGALLKDTDGAQAALSRPDVRAEADALRNRLQEQASTRRATLAQETNEQRADLVAAASQRKEQLTAEADRLRNQLTDTVENRRQQLYRQADELDIQLRSEQRQALAENIRRRQMLMTDMVPVLSEADIAARVPTRSKIDAGLPTKADIDAHVPTAQQIEQQVMPAAEIDRRITPQRAIDDGAFGSDHIESEVNRYLQSQVDGKLPYEALSKLRTLVGNEIDNYSLVDNVPRSKWKALYGALSRDIEAAATTPEARRTWLRANHFYKVSGARLEQLESVIDKNGGPEKVYQSALSGTGDGATTLRAVMRSLPNESKRELTAAFIRRMGRATPGQQNDVGDAFSMNSFLTNWSRVSPEARKALFDPHGAGFSNSLDRIAKTASNLREGSKVFANPSGTASRGALVGGVTGTGATVFGLLASGHLGAAGVAAGVAIGGAGAFNGMSRAMANPRFVAWLSESTKMPVSSIPAQVVMLRRIADQTDDESVAEVADELERVKP